MERRRSEVAADIRQARADYRAGTVRRGTAADTIVMEESLRRQLLEVLLAPAEPCKIPYEEFLAWADEDTLAEWVDGEVRRALSVNGEESIPARAARCGGDLGLWIADSGGYAGECHWSTAKEAEAEDMKRALVCGAGPVEYFYRQRRRHQDLLFHRAGGFIGGRPSTELRAGLVKKLKREGYWVRGVDIKEHDFAPPPVPPAPLTPQSWGEWGAGARGQADEFLLLDLREPQNCQAALTLRQPFDKAQDKAQGRLLDDGAFDEVCQLAADMGGREW